MGLGVVTGAAIRHSWLSLYDAIRTFTTTGIALPRQGNVPGLTGMPSHTQSDFRYAEMKKPPALTSGSKLLVMAQVAFWLSPHNSAFGLSMSPIHERCHLALHHLNEGINPSLESRLTKNRHFVNRFPTES